VSRARPTPFQGRHFADVIIILCVRWYLRYSLSYRDQEENGGARLGRGSRHDLALGPTLFSPFESAASPRTATSQRLWRADETYVKVAGKWTYLYRAVDSSGDTIDFMLSPKRDLTSAKLFLRLALSGTSGKRPRLINVEDTRPMLARFPN
jgi:transposase-like protein